MIEQLRIATFNLENLDDVDGASPSLAERIAVMRPQLLRLRADILCLQEVNGQGTAQNRTLSALDHLIATTPYETYCRAYTKTEGAGIPYDERNLVILSRFPFLGEESIYQSEEFSPFYRKITAIPPEPTAKKIEWERPILHVQVDFGGNRLLHLFTVHLKSKIPTKIPGQMEGQYKWKSVSAWAEGYFISSMKQLGQALQLRCTIDNLFTQGEANGSDPLIAITGDFNAEPGSIPLNALCGPVEETGNPDLGRRVMVPCENTIPETSRYSLFHLGKGQMIDHVLVSRAMMPYYRGAEIHNEILPDESGAFRTDVLFPESDHAPVVAEFSMP